jgi:hypothetical protein
MCFWSYLHLSYDGIYQYIICLHIFEVTINRRFVLTGSEGWKGLMILRLKVHQVMSLGNGMVRLILVRPSLKARVQPLQRSDEQKIAEDLTSKMQQAFESILPGGIMVGGPTTSSGRWDAKIDIMMTDQEYEESGKPGINEMINIELKKDPRETTVQ